jgi:hypothetical protein
MAGYGLLLEGREAVWAPKVRRLGTAIADAATGWKAASLDATNNFAPLNADRVGTHCADGVER